MLYVQKRDRPGHGFRAAAQVISYVSIAVPKRTNYGDFIKTLLADDLKAMNKDMNDVTLTTFSYFDRGEKPSKSEPERFHAVEAFTNIFGI